MGRTGNTFFFATSVVILGSVSVFLAAFHTRPLSYSDAYAILTLPAAVDDAAVVRTLATEGIEGTVSESTQWLMMDNFGELERIKLSEYGERVADFDPRNDGYADKLRSLFIAGSERRFFLPKPLVLLDGEVFTQNITRAISKLESSIVDSTTFTLDLGAKTLISLSSFYYFLAGVIALVMVSFYTRSLFRSLLLVPSVFSLSLFGPAGLVAAGFLFAMTGPFKDAILEILGRIDRMPNSSKDRKIVPDWLFSSTIWKTSFLKINSGTYFGFHPISIPVLLALATLITVSVSGVVPWLVSIVSFICTLIFIIVESMLERSKALESGHTPFIPLVMMPRKHLFPLSKLRTSTPFVLVAALCLIADAFLLMAFPTFGKVDAAALTGPDMHDYEAHIDFQRSFSLRRLSDDVLNTAYTNYELDETGLVMQAEGQSDSDVFAKPSPYPAELPPVERIMKRMNQLPSGSLFSATGGSLSSPSIMTVAFSICMTAPMFLGSGITRRRSKNAAFLAAKRMAA